MTNQHPARLQDTSGEGLPTLRVAVLGAGTVGTEVLRLISQQGEELAHRIGGRLEITGVAVRDTERDRGEHVPAPMPLTTSSAE